MNKNVKGWINFFVTANYRTIPDQLGHDSTQVIETINTSRCSSSKVHFYNQDSINGLRIEIRFDGLSVPNIEEKKLSYANNVLMLIEYLIAKSNPGNLFLPKLNVFQSSMSFRSENGQYTARAETSIVTINECKVSESLNLLEKYDRLSDDALFSLKAFDMSLKSDDSRMRFYTLFCIIERIEQNYKSINGACERYNINDISCLKTACDEISKDLFAEIKNQLSKLTNIGRNQCLVNILNYMNITRFNDGSMIDKQKIKKITDVRNVLFHGRNADDVCELNTRLKELLDICLQIMDFLIIAT